MNGSVTETSQIRYARLAGFMYLFVDATYALALFITGRFKVPGNFPETAHRIMASELLYRVGLSSSLLASLCTVLLGVGLYVALKPVDDNLALTALLFRLVEAALFGVQVIIAFVVLKLYVAADYTNAFATSQLSALANLRSVASVAGFNIAATFFSVGSTLFFYLFLKSNYIPRFLSAWGLIGSVLVPMVCFATLLWPQYDKMFFLGWIPIGAAEIAVGLWLLFKGVNVRPGQI